MLNTIFWRLIEYTKLVPGCNPVPTGLSFISQGNYRTLSLIGGEEGTCTGTVLYIDTTQTPVIVTWHTITWQDAHVYLKISWELSGVRLISPRNKVWNLDVKWTLSLYLTLCISKLSLFECLKVYIRYFFFWLPRVSPFSHLIWHLDIWYHSRPMCKILFLWKNSCYLVNYQISY